jgi:hypothetical protein
VDRGSCRHRREAASSALAEAPQEVRDLVDAICLLAHRQTIFFLWRPLLPDPKDDMVAELAVAAQCDAVITHNVSDFVPIDPFGINQLINSAVAEKLAALMTEEYLEQRARRGSRRKLKAILAKVPNAAPDDRDQLPTGLTRRRKKAG